MNRICMVSRKERLTKHHLLLVFSYTISFMRKIRFLLSMALISWFVSAVGFAQGQESFSLQDSNQVSRFIQSGNSFLDEDQIDSASFYFEKANRMARAINFHKGIWESNRGNNKVLNRKGRYQEALQLALESVELCKELTKLDLAIAYNNLGNVYQYLGDLNLAATHYLNSLQLAEKIGELRLQQKLNNNLATVFLELEEKDKSFQYSSKAYKLAIQNKDSVGIASSLVNLGVAEILNKRYEKATRHLNQVLEFGHAFNDPSYVLDGYINLGDLEAAKNNNIGALGYYKKALTILDKYPVPDYELYVFFGLAQNYFRLKQYREANLYLQKSIQTGQSINALKELRKIYLLGSEISEYVQKPVLALDYRKKYEALNDSLLNLNTQQSIHKLETEYRTSLKEKAIAQQKLIIANNNLEIEKKNNQIFFTTAIVIGLFLTVIIFILVYHTKQKTNAEKLRSIQRQNEIKVLMATVEGEEKERTRLARELHDGVGGILSATKMHMSILKSETAIFVDPAKFEHTISMLDHAAQEIRSIAHNLSPAVFTNYDLDGALSAFCRSVSNPTLKVDYYFIGEVPTYVHSFRLVVYRIVQELINNVIKHSHATEALVQISQHENILSVTVEDNGIGFEVSESDGIGLANLEQRVKDFNGHMSIDSDPGRGTTVYLEFDTSAFVVFNVAEPSS